MEQSGSVVWRNPRQSADQEAGEGMAVVAMTFEHIEEALGLPEGVRLTAVCVDAMLGVVQFRFDGVGLPSCAEGAAIERFEALSSAWGQWASI